MRFIVRCTHYAFTYHNQFIKYPDECHYCHKVPLLAPLFAELLFSVSVCILIVFQTLLSYFWVVQFQNELRVDHSSIISLMFLFDSQGKFAISVIHQCRLNCEESFPSFFMAITYLKKMKRIHQKCVINYGSTCQFSTCMCPSTLAVVLVVALEYVLCHFVTNLPANHRGRHLKWISLPQH